MSVGTKIKKNIEVFMAGNKVTKFDLVESVHDKVNCEKKVVQSVIESLLEEIKIA